MQPRFATTFMIVMPSMAVVAAGQSRADYVGGTQPDLAVGKSGTLELRDDRYFAFYPLHTGAKQARAIRVAYEKINLLEYGQRVERRLALAVVISPLFLMAKSRRHFLTIGYTDEDGKQQALVFRVEKDSIRSALASLEARTGLKIEFQDEEARKAGRG